MQQTFSKDFMRKNCGCYSIEKLNECSFMKVKGETVYLKDIVKSEIPLKDKFWFLCQKVASVDQNRKIAIDLAEIVLPIYESKHPNNKSARECIKAAKLFLAGHISLSELIDKRNAAADDAADAADAVYAAAGAAADADSAAAYVAVYAADVIYAVYATDAVYNAVNAAVCAADDYTTKIKSYLENITND